MWINQTGKRFYQVKIKGLDITSIKELGRLMGPLQMQVFRKAYGKILDLDIHGSRCITHPILWPAFEMLHVWRLPISTNCWRIWGDSRMSSWGKKTVSFLRVSSLFEQDCNCGQGFGKRVGSCKANSKRRSGPTTEVLGRQGKGYGKSRIVGPVCGHISISNLWGCPLFKHGRFGGPSRDWCFPCISP